MFQFNMLTEFYGNHYFLIFLPSYFNTNTILFANLSFESLMWEMSLMYYQTGITPPCQGLTQTKK